MDCLGNVQIINELFKIMNLDAREIIQYYMFYNDLIFINFFNRDHIVVGVNSKIQMLKVPRGCYHV